MEEVDDVGNVNPSYSPERPFGRPTSFEDIGIADQFKLDHQVGEVKYSDLIPLPGLNKTGGNFHLLVSEVSFFDGLETRAKAHILILFNRIGEQYDPVGHVDLSQLTENPADAAMAVSWLSRNSVLKVRDQLPEYYQTAIAGFIDETGADAAIRILDKYRKDSQYKQLKLGGVLLALALGYVETKGAVAVGIWGDATEDKVTKKGFYDRYGAKNYMGQKKSWAKVDIFSDHPGKPEWVNEEKKNILTHLTPEQEVMVAKAFDIDLLKS